MRTHLSRALALGVLVSFVLTLAGPAVASQDDALQNQQQLQSRVKGDNPGPAKVQTRNQFQLETGQDGDDPLSLTADQDRTRRRDGEGTGVPERDRDRLQDCLNGLCQSLQQAWRWVRN